MAAKTMKTKRLHHGSVQHQISLMAVGDIKWVESCPEKYAQVQREWNLPKSRRIKETKSFILECSTWQALRVNRIAEPTLVLVRIQRIA